MKIWASIEEVLEAYKEHTDSWQREYLNNPLDIDRLDEVQIWRMRRDRHMSINSICIITGKYRPDIIIIIEQLDKIHENVL